MAVPGNAASSTDWLSDRYVSDGGLETSLIYDYGIDLPEFAAFPLLEDPAGRAALRDYYDSFADIARRAGAGLTLESPTWRANRDWAERVGYDSVALDRVNRAAIQFMGELRESYTDIVDVRIIGSLGPRGDGYVPGEQVDPEEAAEYHRPQIESLAAAGVDLIAVYTLTGVEEGIGIARACQRVGVPVLIGFTVETDGRLPDGTQLRTAVERVDAEAAPNGFIVNCTHPAHIAAGLEQGKWLTRVVQVNPNASRFSHAELDAATELDLGDIADLAATYDVLRALLPNLRVIGGCCGTGPEHVAALWGV